MSELCPGQGTCCSGRGRASTQICCGALEQLIPLGASVSCCQAFAARAPQPGANVGRLGAGARPSAAPGRAAWWRDGSRRRGGGSRALSRPPLQTPARPSACGGEWSRACRPPSRLCASPSAGSTSPSRSQALSTRWPSGRPRPWRARGRVA